VRIVGTISNHGLTHLVAKPSIEGGERVDRLRGTRIATGKFGRTPNAVTRYVLRLAGTFNDRLVFRDVVDTSFVERAHASLAGR
jgi:ABC-type nitrate/sulfonate/bicarbonate transport system substrate-binding protein